jgi:hypothetical protein
MAKYRRAARTDENQQKLVKQLRSIPGVTVQTGVDDILIGCDGKNYWIELKDPEKVLKKTGDLKAGTMKKSQIKLKQEWKGQYLVAWTLEQILQEIGVTK